jgi:hypothetical protein
MIERGLYKTSIKPMSKSALLLLLIRLVAAWFPNGKCSLAVLIERLDGALIEVFIEIPLERPVYVLEHVRWN